MVCASTDLPTGASSYQKLLSADAQVTGEVYGAKFSASANYKEVKSGTNGNQKVYVEAIAKCTQYKATLKSGINVSL